MRASRTHLPKFPLGFRFAQGKRNFQVVETFYGPLENLKWTIETPDGLKIHGSAPDGEEQTAAGFRELSGSAITGELVVRKTSQLEGWLKSNAIKII